jgi:hypothetical protein
MPTRQDEALLFVDRKYAATFMAVAAEEKWTPNGRRKAQARTCGKAAAIGHSRKFQNLNVGSRQAAAQTLSNHVVCERFRVVLSPTRMARGAIARAALPDPRWADQPIAHRKRSRTSKRNDPKTAGPHLSKRRHDTVEQHAIS